MTTETAPVIQTRDDILRQLKYTPTAAQKIILDDDHKTQLVAGGFRGGKSRTASIKGSVATLEFLALYGEQAVGQVAWLVGEEYEKCRAEFNHPDGSLLLDMQKVFGRAVKGSARIDPGTIRVPVLKESDPTKIAGYFTIKTKSANDPTSLGMESPVWIILCEAAQVTFDTYTRLLSRVSEAQQRFPEFGWLHMEGTFEGSLGWYPSYWEKWQSPAAQEIEDARSFSLPSESNTHIYPGGAEDPGILKLKATLPEDKFLERHMGVPVPPSGRVHSSFQARVHIRNVKYDPEKPLYIAIDPGYSGQPSAYVVEVMQRSYIGEHEFHQWNLLDEIAINKQTMPGFTAKDVCDVAMGKWWWANTQKYGVIDTAGAAHAGAQESNVETWMKNTGLILRNEPVKISPGIDRMDTCLKVDPLSGEPGLIVDPRCRKFIAEMGGGPDPFDGETRVYMWGTDKNNEVMGRVPRDRFNDAIKAVTYMMVNVLGYAFGSKQGNRIRVKSRKRRKLGRDKRRW